MATTQMIDPLNTVKIQRAIQEQLEEAYVADGRDNPEHPMHCLYTGLFRAPVYSVDNKVKDKPEKEESED